MTTVEFLEEAKWSFIGLDAGTRHALVRHIERLGANGHPLTGTRNVYRGKFGGYTILYHHRDGRTTILSLRLLRAGSEVHDLLEAKKTRPVDHPGLVPERTPT